MGLHDVADDMLWDGEGPAPDDEQDDMPESRRWRGGNWMDSRAGRRVEGEAGAETISTTADDLAATDSARGA